MLAEDLMRQAFREPDVKPSINRNLAGILITSREDERSVTVRRSSFQG